MSLRSLYKIGIGVGVLLLVGWWLFGRGLTNTSIQHTHATMQDAPKIYTPVVYDVASFDKLAVPQGDTTKDWLTGLGAATTETALDIFGDGANLYRYHTKNEPIMYVIDSNKFFEMVWYYPSKTDSDQDKQLAQKYAQVTYNITKSALRTQAFGFYKTLLAGKSADLPKGVVIGTCQDYLCRIVMDKAVLFQ